MSLRDNTATLQEILTKINNLPNRGGGSTSLPLQSKTVTPTENSQTVRADSGYGGLSSVNVEAIPSQYIIPSGELDIGENNKIYDVAQYASVNVTIPEEAFEVPDITVSTTGLITASANGESATKQLTTKAGTTISPTESVQTAIASGTYATGDIKIGAISTTYVGSGVTKRSSTDLSASGATVTVPAGYYSSQATKSVSTTTHPDPTINVSAAGLITASHVQSTGYVTGGTTSKTQQLTTKAAATITPTTSEQTAVNSGVYTTGAIKVAAIQTETKSISDNGTYTPTSGKYFSSVTVSIPIQRYYTGTSAPASSTGSNGDLYFMRG